MHGATLKFETTVEIGYVMEGIQYFVSL